MISMLNIWRRKRERKIDALTQRLRDFKPSPTFAEYNFNSDVIFIGLFGTTGVGKSSLINSMLSLMNPTNEFLPAQCGSPEHQTGFTLYRQRFELTDHIQLIDNRGMDRIGSKAVLDEIRDQLEGKRGHATEVNTSKRGSAISGNPVHAAIVVVNGTQNYGAEEKNDGRRFVLQFKKCIGRSPLAVITHEDVTNGRAMKSTRLYLASIGIDKNDVFEVANRTAERDELRARHKLQLLKLLNRCTMEAEVGAEFRAQHRFEEELLPNELRATENVMNDDDLMFHREFNNIRPERQNKS